MQHTERTVISTITLLTSLAFYWYAKANDKTEVPYVMLGGYLGSIIGEAVAHQIQKPKQDEHTDH